ncbi:carbon starvation protein A [uncultured Fusobacterium sp.]|uniref:carbon starvation CstA family protein n=1 Tax=uncultured Fusobacterium sp. TaxID=159267 RepID=UPI002612897D|nr:carbon starvation protein A [uncultured Fusobacterium sp.]
MKGVTILLATIFCFFVAYVTYGSWLAKQWDIDPKRKTPSHEFEDGIDYIPAKAPVLLGHHFASIAGAGPINGPIQAAVFGWVPVLLWIVLGGIFFGTVQDFSAIVVSIRHKGKSLGEVIEENIGHRCKLLFTIFSWLVLLLVVAAFSDIVASTFQGYAINPDGTKIMYPANGSVATASMLFIPLSIAFGFLVYRKNAPLAVSSIAGVVLLAICIAVGLKYPIYFSKNFWLGVVFFYIFIASVTPVWILLQPRDYLNSFLLYFMIVAAVIGIFGTNPTINLPAFTGWTSSFNGQVMFPYLFITVACGAISGFHSLIASGTTSKQLDSEKDAKLIGYGSMLIECVLAVIALIAVGALFSNGKMPQGTPAVVFASAISGFFRKLGMGEVAVNTTFTVISLAISAFALTSLDTATRLGRFLFQELFITKNKEKENKLQKCLGNMYVGTFITVGIGAILCLGGYQNIWPLFGACNQLVAVPCFLGVSVWLAKKGKKNFMLLIPMFFMLFATMSSLLISFKTNLLLLLSGEGKIAVQGLQVVVSLPIFILALVLVVEGMKILWEHRKKVSATA